MLPCGLDAMATKTKRTTANGNAIKFDPDEESSTLRRVAAALPRDAGIDRIASCPKADATVWFGDGAETDAYFVSRHVDVVDVFVPSSARGKVGVEVNLR